MTTVERKRGRITSADSPRITSGSGHLTRGFPPERCPKCHEALTGVRKCKCQMGRKPTGMVWINGMLRFVDGCPNCGGTLHSMCSRRVKESDLPWTIRPMAEKGV